MTTTDETAADRVAAGCRAQGLPLTSRRRSGGLAGIAAVVVILFLQGCTQAPRVSASAGEQPDNQSFARARTLCETVGLPFATEYGDSTLRTSVDTRVGAFNAWTRDRGGKDGPIPVDDAVDGPSEAFMALCYYEGVYPSLPRGPAADAGPYNWIAITVTEDGTADLWGAMRDEGTGDFRPQGDTWIPPEGNDEPA